MIKKNIILFIGFFLLIQTCWLFSDDYTTECENEKIITNQEMKTALETGNYNHTFIPNVNYLKKETTTYKVTKNKLLFSVNKKVINKKISYRWETK